MDAKLLLAIFLIAVLLPDAECWGRRRRRGRWSFHLSVGYGSNPGCKWICPRFCTPDKICTFVCKKLCGKKKQVAENDSEGHLTPLSRNFDFYDLNDDRAITLEEIQITLGEKKENCEEMYKHADTDHDGKLSLEEFENGPFVFEKYPGDDDDDQGDGKPGQGGDKGNPGQDGDNGNTGQGAGKGNGGNQGNNPDQRSIEFDEE